MVLDGTPERLANAEMVSASRMFASEKDEPSRGRKVQGPILVRGEMNAQMEKCHGKTEMSFAAVENPAGQLTFDSLGHDQPNSN